MAAGACSPHPEKRKTGGEDAHVIRPDPSGGIIAVADGVGGYKEYGVDAGLYSRRLLQNLADAFMLAERANSGKPPNPREALATAHEATKVAGATTAVVIALNGATRKMTALNLGDSGFRVFRDGALIFSSPDLEHSFNCPYQLGCARYVPNTDKAEDGQIFEMDVAPGDLVVMATDGVLDNLRDTQIEEIVASAMSAAEAQGFTQAKAVAEALVARARACASDPEYMSPYIEQAAALGLIKNPLGAFGAKLWTPKGGKEDDITVVAAVVLDVSQEWVQGDFTTSVQAARAAVAAIPSAVGDAELEGRRVWIGAHEMDDSPSTRRMEAAKVAAAVANGEVIALFSPAEVDQMDTAGLRRELGKLGLPTSGKTEVLRKRLAEVPRPADSN